MMVCVDVDQSEPEKVKAQVRELSTRVLKRSTRTVNGPTAR